jgi:uncharacterized protein YeaO (DUF488 family)
MTTSNLATSNFANNQRYGLNGISISRYPDRRSGFTGPEFPPLMPSAQLLAWYKSTDQGEQAWAEYADAYNAQLNCLKADAVLAEIEVLCDAYDAAPILLCYESAKTLDTQPCHRRLAAAWFERELGIVVPEWSKPL